MEEEIKLRLYDNMKEVGSFNIENNITSLHDYVDLSFKHCEENNITSCNMIRVGNSRMIIIPISEGLLYSTVAYYRDEDNPNLLYESPHMLVYNNKLIDIKSKIEENLEI